MFGMGKSKKNKKAKEEVKTVKEVEVQAVEEPKKQSMNEKFPGKHIVVSGTISTGFKFWGEFSNVEEAVEWAKKNSGKIGGAAIVKLDDPQDLT